MHSRAQLACSSVVVGFLLASALVAQSPRSSAKHRVQPPEFNKATSANVFFDDVFAKLVGNRPKTLTGTAATGRADPVTTHAGNNDPGSTGGANGWSKWISSSTIEDEVKALKLSLDTNVTTPSDFAGRGHKPVRRDLTTLAMMFAIIAEYDGDVRWKKDAPGIRDMFARTAANTKAGGNSQVYNEAKVRKTELQELLSGNPPPVKEAEIKATWPQVCDRSPLMQRLEAAFDGKLAPLVANKEDFAKNKPLVKHEAEVIAALAEVLNKEGMDDADDETYREFALTMKKAATEIVDSVKLDNYDKARESVGVITKTCTECHQSYRG